jgi:hypothetical protein
MPALVKKAKREFEKHAKQTLDVQQIGGALYAFGSELACLRLERAYRYCGDRAHADYSPARDTWYFSLETRYSNIGE